MRGLSRFIGMLPFRFIYPFHLSILRTQIANVLLPGSFIGILLHCQKKSDRAVER